VLYPSFDQYRALLRCTGLRSVYPFRTSFGVSVYRVSCCAASTTKRSKILRMDCGGDQLCCVACLCVVNASMSAGSRRGALQPADGSRRIPRRQPAGALLLAACGCSSPTSNSRQSTSAPCSAFDTIGIYSNIAAAFTNNQKDIIQNIQKESLSQIRYAGRRVESAYVFHSPCSLLCICRRARF